MIVNVRITGFGGQGVITAGYILGKAASIYDNKHSVFTQSYGPEARGSACSSQVRISEDPVLYPFIKKHDILVGLSQEGFDKFIDQTEKDGKVLIDEDLVEIKNDGADQLNIIRIPSTRLAEKNFNNRIVANIIMLGFLTGITGIVSEQAIKDAVESVVPRRMVKLNIEALEYGMNYYKSEQEFVEIQ